MDNERIEKKLSAIERGLRETITLVDAATPDQAKINRLAIAVGDLADLVRDLLYDHGWTRTE
jgi:hypothetical protein